LKPVYEWLSRTGIFKWALSYGRKKRFMSINRPGGQEVQMVVHNRMIAKKVLKNGKIYVRRPFHPFVDEDLLADK
jgi:hypothetical protein